MIRRAIPLAAGAFVAMSCSETTAPSTGVIRVTMNVTEPDADNFSFVRIDDELVAIGSRDQVNLYREPGHHSIGIQGVALNFRGNHHAPAWRP